MPKQNKYQFFKGGVSNNSSALELEALARQNYINKFYNIWMSKFKWNGLDSAEQENFIMRKMWSDGTLACRYMNDIDTLVFAPYGAAEFNLYDFPSMVNLVNLRGVSQAIIPARPLAVNKEVVLGWAQPNHKPIASIVRYYVDRMVQVDMVINTNLQLQKMPFLVGVDEADKDRMQDVVRRILNNEVVVFLSLEDVQRIQALVTQTPYIIDKLMMHRHALEQELLTYLGIDNNGNESLEQTHVTSDAVNANNDMINDYGYAIEDEIRKWLGRIKDVFGREVTIEAVSRPVKSVQEESKDEE